MEKKWSIINLLSVVLVITVNYVSQALRLNGTTIGEISDKYDNLFTPAPYAFAIWGLIFLALIAFAVYFVYAAFSSKTDAVFVNQTGPWFALANLLNSLWVLVFMYEYIGLSVLIMLGILIALLMVIVRTDMERWDAPIETIAFAWWPICLYSGWIAVATIANISTYLTKLQWQGGFLTEVQWTVMAIILATLVNILMIKKRNMREFAAVGVWALIAIFLRHQNQIGVLALTALLGAIVLLLYIGYHGYRNRATNPFLKLKQRLSKESYPK